MPRLPRSSVVVAFALCVALGAGVAPSAGAAPARSAPVTVPVDVLLGVGAPAQQAHGRAPFFTAVRIGGESRPWSLSVATAQQLRPYERTYGVSFALAGIVQRTDGGATIDTGRRMSPWGHLRFHLRAATTTVFRSRCETRTASTGVLRPTRLGEPGFDLRTHTDRFHEIVRTRMRGTLLHLAERVDPGCSGGGGPPPGCYPFAGIATAPDRRLDFEAVRRHGGGVQLLAGYEGRRRGAGFPLETVSVGMPPDGRTFPNSHFWTARDGSASVVKGANGGPFPGRMRFRPSAPPHNDGTKRCLEYFEKGRPSGTLRARFQVFGTRLARGDLFAEITMRADGTTAAGAQPSSGADPQALFATPLRTTTTAAALAELIRSGRTPLEALGLLASR